MAADAVIKRLRVPPTQQLPLPASVIIHIASFLSHTDVSMWLRVSRENHWLRPEIHNRIKRFTPTKEMNRCGYNIIQFFALQPDMSNFRPTIVHVNTVWTVETLVKLLQRMNFPHIRAVYGCGQTQHDTEILSRSMSAIRTSSITDLRLEWRTTMEHVSLLFASLPTTLRRLGLHLSSYMFTPPQDEIVVIRPVQCPLLERLDLSFLWNWADGHTQTWNHSCFQWASVPQVRHLTLYGGHWPDGDPKFLHPMTHNLTELSLIGPYSQPRLLASTLPHIHTLTIAWLPNSPVVSKIKSLYWEEDYSHLKHLQKLQRLRLVVALRGDGYCMSIKLPTGPIIIEVGIIQSACVDFIGLYHATDDKFDRLPVRWHTLLPSTPSVIIHCIGPLTVLK